MAAKKQIKEPYTLNEISLKLTSTLDNLFKRFDKLPNDTELGDVTRLAASISTMSGIYVKAYQVSDIEKRLAELEANQE